MDTSLSGHRVVRMLQRLLETRGKPSVIQVDNGPEFTGRALDPGALWAVAHKNQVKLHFIEPGKPTQNGVIESFNGKMRLECLNLECLNLECLNLECLNLECLNLECLNLECLNLEWFMDLHHARSIIENWRHDYNNFRPHSSLKNLPPTIWALNQVESLSLQVA